MKQTSIGLKLAASLALITILGPSAIDMYLPSMPDMAKDLHTSYGNIQVSLTVFLMALGAGQLVFGPLIDAYGRRLPLLIGLVVFAAASVGAAFSSSIEWLLIVRFIQGMAAALTLVVAMSTVRDVAEGNAAAQLFALLMTIEALAPVLAPAVGGYLDAHFGWQSVLYVLAILALCAFVNAMFNLPESLPVEKRISLKFGEVIRTYARIASCPSFLMPALALSAVFFFLFGYIGGAAYVYQTHFNLEADTFGFVFGGTGIAVLLGALVSSKWVPSMGVLRLANRGVLLIVLGALIAALATYFGWGLSIIVVGMFVALFGLGIAESTLMSMAMASQQQALGSTAALLGAFQLVISSMATPIAGTLAELSALHWCAFLFFFSVFVLLLTVFTVRQAHKQEVLQQKSAQAKLQATAVQG
ncbi:multidrug effflux MFS transporter [Pseudomonas sp. F1_0610]|uniref:multidrug effflux MFS transporter n=1 Tax=Pseudomonas sp. F1_0610 TaxID=3114284 RepID=UPI0039C3062E